MPPITLALTSVCAPCGLPFSQDTPKPPSNLPEKAVLNAGLAAGSRLGLGLGGQSGPRGAAAAGGEGGSWNSSPLPFFCKPLRSLPSRSRSHPKFAGCLSAQLEAEREPLGLFLVKLSHFA